jgi:3-oxoacyl-[acyl-carrier protein] reductase
MSRLEGKVAIVTGASRGIGKGIAIRLGHEGARVVVNYNHNQGQAEDVVHTIQSNGGEAIALQVNMSDIPQIERMVCQTIEQFGQVDIMVSNAGIELLRSFEETRVEDFDQLFAVNTRGQFFAAQQAATHMKNGGRIVLTSSMSVIKGIAGHALYAASKGAVEVLVRNLAVELGPLGITINAIAPGATVSDMSTRMAAAARDPKTGLSPIEQCIAATPLGRLGTPEDIAKVVAFLVSEEGSWITGQTIQATGGFSF